MKSELMKEQLKLLVQVEQETHERELRYLERRHEAELRHIEETRILNLKHAERMQSLLAQVDHAKSFPDLVREAAKSQAEETKQRFPDIFGRVAKGALESIVLPPKAKRKPHKKNQGDRRRNKKK